MVAIAAGDTAEIERWVIQEMRTRGWVEVNGYHQSAIGLIDGLFNAPVVSHWKRGSIEEWMPELRTVPISLDNTILRNAEVNGAMPSGQTTKEGHTGLARLLLHSKLGRVAFIENEYTFTGKRTHIDCEKLRDCFNGRPIVYVVAKTASGAATTTIAWYTESREFQFYVDLAILKSDPWYQKIETGLMQPLSNAY